MRASAYAAICISATLAVAGGACSLLVDTNGLSGGDGGAPLADASSDAPVASDAALDAAGDARGDASQIAFCDAHPGHTLCFDFDESTALPSYDSSSFDPTLFFIDSTTSRSSPHSIAAKYAAGVDSTEYLQRDFPSTRGGLVSWIIDLKFTATDLSTGQIIPLSTHVPVTPGMSDHFFYLQTYLGDFILSEATAPDDGGAPYYTADVLVSPVPNDTWMHVEVTIDGSTGIMKASLDGVPLADGHAQIGFPSTGTAHVLLGGFAGSLAADSMLHVDNLIVDY